MGLIILTVMGAIFGWLAAIVSEIYSVIRVASNIAAGAAGALLVGEIGNPGSVLNGLSPTALLLGVAGALLFIAVTNLVRIKA